MEPQHKVLVQVRGIDQQVEAVEVVRGDRVDDMRERIIDQQGAR